MGNSRGNGRERIAWRVFIGLFLAVIAGALAAFIMEFIGTRGPVVIEGFYPRADHEEMISFYQRLAEEHPGRVTFRFYDFTTKPGFARFKKTGLECGGTFINGRTYFEVPGQDGKPRKVNTLKRLGYLYDEQDARDVLEQELRHRRARPFGGYHAGPMVGGGIFWAQPKDEFDRVQFARSKEPRRTR